MAPAANKIFARPFIMVSKCGSCLQNFASLYPIGYVLLAALFYLRFLFSRTRSIYCVSRRFASDTVLNPEPAKRPAALLQPESFIATDPQPLSPADLKKALDDLEMIDSKRN